MGYLGSDLRHDLRAFSAHFFDFQLMQGRGPSWSSAQVISHASKVRQCKNVVRLGRKAAAMFRMT